MDSALVDLALTNLTAPMVLFFALGFVSSLARSDLSIPEPLSKGLSLYLMLAIGFKGGVALEQAGLTVGTVKALGLGIALSFLLPFIAYALLRATTRLDRVNAAAVAAHYGSISVVTFVAATSFLSLAGVTYSGYLVAVMAAMETPAIIAGLWLARRGQRRSGGPSPGVDRAVFREIFLNGSVVLLLGSFAIGAISGPHGDEMVAPFVRAPFKGVLCLFLLDMGISAARRLRGSGALSPRVLAFGVYMPLVGGSVAIALGSLAGLPQGDVILLAVLAASASYIAVPAAMRLALPEASPAISLTLSLGVTFPVNLALGIPLYFTLSGLAAGR